MKSLTLILNHPTLNERIFYVFKYDTLQSSDTLEQRKYKILFNPIYRVYFSTFSIYFTSFQIQ
ncbi:MAG: hypothetical protein ACI9U5_000213 [Colwellia sp.]|jgi:hypothetical protein